MDEFDLIEAAFTRQFAFDDEGDDRPEWLADDEDLAMEDLDLLGVVA